MVMPRAFSSGSRFGIDSGERLDERTFAMIDVSSSPDDEMADGHSESLGLGAK